MWTYPGEKAKRSTRSIRIRQVSLQKQRGHERKETADVADLVTAREGCNKEGRKDGRMDVSRVATRTRDERGKEGEERDDAAALKENSGHAVSAQHCWQSLARRNRSPSTSPTTSASCQLSWCYRVGGASSSMNNCGVLNVSRIKLITAALLRTSITASFINYCVLNVARIMATLRGEYKIKKNNNNNIEMVRDLHTTAVAIIDINALAITLGTG